MVGGLLRAASVTSCMPSERSGKNLKPKIERDQGLEFSMFFSEIFTNMLKNSWFFSNIGFVDMLCLIASDVISFSIPGQSC